MSETGQENTSTDPADFELVKEQPRSLALAERGVKTGADFANMMSALMSDIISERIAPEIANAACNAGGKLLKVVEMQYRYGGKEADRQLTLAPGAKADEPAIS